RKAMTHRARVPLTTERGTLYGDWSIVRSEQTELNRSKPPGHQGTRNTMANLSTVAEFALSLPFAAACRWIQSKPAHFLHFAVLPFGGRQIERWPRFLLVLLRGAAALGFVAFLMAAIDAVLPLSRDDLMTGADCIKCGIVIVIAFAVLRRTESQP
ncbi:MAG TPA: hypothetical protein VI431_00150, partial [Candidatus Acidoferrum sp.]